LDRSHHDLSYATDESQLGGTRLAPVTPGKSPVRYSALVVAGWCFCLLIGLAQLAHYWPEVIDDSFITFRYARNFVHGFGFAFNPGDGQVEGFSNPTWLWIQIAALKLGVVDLLSFTKILGIALYVATLFGVWVLAGGLKPGARPRTLIAPALFALNPFAAYHAVVGLETPLYVALLVGCACAVPSLATRPVRTTWLLAALLSLVIATRPEGFGYAIALLVTAAIVHRGTEATDYVLAVAVATVGSFLILEIWRWHQFDLFLPNTAFAKMSGPSGSESLAAGIHYIVRFAHPGLLPVDPMIYLFTAMALIVWGSRHDLLLAAPVACALVFAVAARGDWMHSFRFLVPAVPFLCVLIGRAAIVVAEHRPWRRLSHRGRLAASVLALAVAVFGIQQAMIRSTRIQEGRYTRGWKSPSWPFRLPERLAEGFPARLAGITRWSIEHLSSRHLLATGDIGFPAWASGARVLDLAGLTDHEMALIVPHRDLAGFTSYLERRAPAVIVCRYEDDAPASVFDEFTIRSGLLSGYVLTDSVSSYGRNVVARIYRRTGEALDTSRDSVLARYDRAIAWNPNVPKLREWRNEFASEGLHATDHPAQPCTGESKR
jgi:hypothetical protein